MLETPSATVSIDFFPHITILLLVLSKSDPIITRFEESSPNILGCSLSSSQSYVILLGIVMEVSRNICTGCIEV